MELETLRNFPSVNALYLRVATQLLCTPAVVSAFELVFAQFKVLGTVGAVVRYLRQHNILLPCRIMGGKEYGKIIFQPVTYFRVQSILTNPHYTDALTYSRTRSHTRPHAALGIANGPRRTSQSPEHWQVIRDHHEPYLSWEEFWATQQQLHENRHRAIDLPRRGPALLSRLLVCGHCGYVMKVGYARSTKDSARAYYVCRSSSDVSLWPSCLSVAAATLEPPVINAVMQALAELTAAALQEALAAEGQEHQRLALVRAEALKQAEAEVMRAERRYKAVAPENALVYRQSEREYEAALRHREQLLLGQAREPAPMPPSAAAADTAVLLQAARDVPQLWNHPAVTVEERKELLRALLDQITCREDKPGVLELTLHWHGSTMTTVQVHRATAIKQRIVAMWESGMDAATIAATLTAEGVRTRRDRCWGTEAIRAVLRKYSLTTPQWPVTLQRMQALCRQGVDARAIAAQLNAEGVPALTDGGWTAAKVGLVLRVARLPAALPQAASRSCRSHGGRQRKNPE